MMTKLSTETLKKVFSSEIKMAALNQERCTLATDDTIKKNCEMLQKILIVINLLILTLKKSLLIKI